MTGYDFGDVVLVPFPFTDQSAVKRRPAVVVSSLAYHQTCPDLLIVAITSQQSSSLSGGEVQVQDWQGAGLLKPSVLKPILTTINPNDRHRPELALPIQVIDPLSTISSATALITCT